jgi:hypothetical protein
MKPRSSPGANLDLQNDSERKSGTHSEASHKLNKSRVCSDLKIISKGTAGRDSRSDLDRPFCRDLPKRARAFSCDSPKIGWARASSSRGLGPTSLACLIPVISNGFALATLIDVRLKLPIYPLYY